MSYNVHNGKRVKYFVSDSIFPQTIDVIKTKAFALGIELEIGKPSEFNFDAAKEYAGLIVQNPDNLGNVVDFSDLASKLKKDKVVFTVIQDILSLCLFKPPGEIGADICCGSAQRMGIPMAFGGPHPGFMACTDKYKRKMPGRIIGVSKDVHGN